MHTRSSYTYPEIKWGARFLDIYQLEDDGSLSIDMTGLSNYEEADLS